MGRKKGMAVGWTPTTISLETEAQSALVKEEAKGLGSFWRKQL